jgi:hypothetical protein
MNGEGSQSDRDKPVEVDDNVIRLTDWLGPREELVPFGPAADSEHTPSAGPKASSPVPAADDFWSESSAAVQDALMAPGADPRHASAATRRAPRSRTSAASVWGRRRAELRAPGTGRTDRGDRPRELPGRALAVSLVAGVVAVALVVLGLATQGESGRVHGGGHGAIEQADRATRSQAVASASRSLGRKAPARLPSRSRTSRRSGTHRVGHNQTGHRATGPVINAQPVGYTTPAPVPESTATTPTTTAPSPTHAPTSSRPTASSVAGSGSSSASQSALGANGSLGPGSSPDG